MMAAQKALGSDYGGRDDCANLCAHGPQSLGDGEPPIELRWKSGRARWGNLRPELVRDLLWPSLLADVGEAEGRRHFVTTAG